MSLLDDDEQFLAFRERQDTIAKTVQDLSKIKYIDDEYKQKELVSEV